MNMAELEYAHYTISEQRQWGYLESYWATPDESTRLATERPSYLRHVRTRQKDWQQPPILELLHPMRARRADTVEPIKHGRQQDQNKGSGYKAL